jgi:hypothetical protein
MGDGAIIYENLPFFRDTTASRQQCIFKIELEYLEHEITKKEGIQASVKHELVDENLLFILETASKESHKVPVL